MFLRTFYTAYDVENKKLGLAKAVASRESPECDADNNLPKVNDSGDANPSSSSTTLSPSEVPAGSPPPNQQIVSITTPSPSKFLGTSPPNTPTELPAAPSAEDPWFPARTPAPVEASKAPVASPAPARPAGVGDANEPGDQTPAQTSSTSKSALIVGSVVSTMVVCAALLGLVLIVRRRIEQRRHRHIKLDPVGVEMPGPSGRGGKGHRGAESAVADADDDFLQAGPGGYRKNGSGSHMYRATGEVHQDNGGRFAAGVVHRGGAEEDADEDDEEVEVDFGNDGEGKNSGSVAERTGGPIGRWFGPQRAGFAAFDDTEDPMMGDGRPSNV